MTTTTTHDDNQVFEEARNRVAVKLVKQSKDKSDFVGQISIKLVELAKEEFSKMIKSDDLSDNLSDNLSDDLNLKGKKLYDYYGDMSPEEKDVFVAKFGEWLLEQSFTRVNASSIVNNNPKVTVDNLQEVIADYFFVAEYSFMSSNPYRFGEWVKDMVNSFTSETFHLDGDELDRVSKIIEESENEKKS